MTTIYLIRHAEAEGNLYRRIQGQFDVNVTPNGYRQIAALEERFQDIPVDACWSSDLLRTRATAQAVCRPKNLPLQLDPGLREICLGRWENVPFGELYTCEPELMDIFDHDPYNWCVEGAETWEAYTTRFLQALDGITSLYPDGTVCLFSHGAVIRGAMKKLFPDRTVGHSDNTAVTLLTREAGVYEAVYFNDTSHLTEEISTLAKQKWWRGDGSRDYNLWFRSDDAVPSGIFAPEHSMSFTAYFEHEPVGAVFLRESASYGELVHMEILPQWRGLELSDQLLGQAVFAFRDLGKTSLRMYASAEDPVMTHICRKHGMVWNTDHWCMDLQLSMK